MHSEVAKGTLADVLKQSGLTLAEFLDFLSRSLGLSVFVEPVEVGFGAGDDG